MHWWIELGLPLSIYCGSCCSNQRGLLLRAPGAGCVPTSRDEAASVWSVSRAPGDGGGVSFSPLIYSEATESVSTLWNDLVFCINRFPRPAKQKHDAPSARLPLWDDPLSHHTESHYNILQYKKTANCLFLYTVASRGSSSLRSTSSFERVLLLILKNPDVFSV